MSAPGQLVLGIPRAGARCRRASHPGGRHASGGTGSKPHIEVWAESRRGRLPFCLRLEAAPLVGCHDPHRANTSASGRTSGEGKPSVDDLTPNDVPCRKRVSSSMHRSSVVKSSDRIDASSSSKDALPSRQRIRHAERNDRHAMAK